MNLSTIVWHGTGAIGVHSTSDTVFIFIYKRCTPNVYNYLQLKIGSTNDCDREGEGDGEDDGDSEHQNNQLKTHKIAKRTTCCSNSSIGSYSYSSRSSSISVGIDNNNSSRSCSIVSSSNSGSYSCRNRVVLTVVL